MKLDPVQPRHLRYRGNYRYYLHYYFIFAIILLSILSLRIVTVGFNNASQIYQKEMMGIISYFFIFGSIYFLWVKRKINKSIQVYSEHILIHHSKDSKEEIKFEDIESLSAVCLSIFFIKMKSGLKYYFHSGFERVDYVLEGIYAARPDLIERGHYEELRIKLVQFDHHQQRKEWFFKHKMIDIFNWIILPLLFICLAYIFQSKHIVIHQQGIYFFRLFMYSMLTLIFTSFIYTFLFKKFIFDRRVVDKLESHEIKLRDLEFEGMVLQKSKIFQLITACFVFAILMKFDLNFFSISKVKEEIALFNMKKGHTLVIDNRYNCTNCRYQVNDGDYVVFGKGTIGQILAKEGDMVGEVSHDKTGRMIASQNIHEVPKGHIAIKVSNGQDIVFIKIEDLIGKVKN